MLSGRLPLPAKENPKCELQKQTADLNKPRPKEIQNQKIQNADSDPSCSEHSLCFFFDRVEFISVLGAAFELRSSERLSCFQLWSGFAPLKGRLTVTQEFTTSYLYSRRGLRPRLIFASGDKASPVAG
jgi:hypothetical protein